MLKTVDLLIVIPWFSRKDLKIILAVFSGNLDATYSEDRFVLFLAFPLIVMISVLGFFAIVCAVKYSECSFILQFGFVFNSLSFVTFDLYFLCKILHHQRFEIL